MVALTFVSVLLAANAGASPQRSNNTKKHDFLMVPLLDEFSTIVPFKPTFSDDTRSPWAGTATVKPCRPARWLSCQ
jgi:hypothetical protein